MTESHTTFISVPKVVCDAGSLVQLNDIVDSLNIKRPLIVTDKGIVNVGLLDQLTAVLDRKFPITVFDDVVADPPEQIVLDAITLAKHHQIDGVIGFGGGSSLDTAKVIARLACAQEQSNQQSLQELYGVDQVRGKRLPLVLVPTTAGTGSEATPVAIITTGETTKSGIVSSLLLPDVALLDANLTLELPREVSAATGIDAMVHAIEAITSKLKRNPFSHSLAMQALQLLSHNIETVCEQPSNVKAREAMLLGSFWAGQAFANAPVGGVHALAYPLGGHFHIPHGLSNALVLPHVLRFNAEASMQDYFDVAHVIGVDCELENAGECLAEYFYQLSGRLAIPRTLAECGVKSTDIATLASDALLQTRLLINNPRPISERDAANIYSNALHGDQT